MRIMLPWPPSVNHYYRHVKVGKGVRVLVSREGRAYRELVGRALLAIPGRWNLPMTGPLRMVIDAYPPDWRRRDLDNICKSLWDSLDHANMFQDDSQIKRFEATMHEPSDGGVVLVEVTPHE